MFSVVRVRLPVYRGGRGCGCRLTITCDAPYRVHTSPTPFRTWDLTVQRPPVMGPHCTGIHPTHVQTCSTWTSPCKDLPHPQTCSNLFIMKFVWLQVVGSHPTGMLSCYCPPMKLREGNVFSCLSTNRGRPVWPLPRMHWTSLYRPPVQGPSPTRKTF